MRERRHLLMLTAYFDDSGTDDQSLYCLLAGFLAREVAWEAFNEDWANALQSDPPLAGLHMSASCFEGFSNEQRDKKLEDLVGVINKHDPVLFACMVHRPLFDAICDEFMGDMRALSKRERRLIRSPYILCLAVVMHWLSRQLAIISAIQPDEQVDLILDVQPGFAGTVQDFHDTFKKQVPLYAATFGRIIFDSDKNVLPLQAADFVAWSIRRTFATAENYPDQWPDPFGTLAQLQTLGLIHELNEQDMRECLRFSAATVRAVNELRGEEP